MKLIIDRTKWLRGEDSEDSYLLRISDNKMCCLGFYSLAKGCSIEDIRGCQEPPDVPKSLEIFPELCKGQNEYYSTPSKLARDMMNVNDNTEMTDAVRESKLAEHFKSIGVEVEFIN